MRNHSRGRFVACLVVGGGALLCGAAMPIAGHQGKAPAALDSAWANVARWYADHLRQVGVVGSSLVLVKDGAILQRQLDGFQDANTRRRVDADTIYHWASITKTFTGIAIMQLRDRGLLTLDDPVVKYVPELREVHNPFGDISQVTVRHLMSHSAGFRSATWPWGGDQPWHPFEPTRWEQLVAMLPYTELLFKPGAKYSYSNPGVVFLGKIIERLSGDDYEMYVTKNVLMPLGMHRTFFDRAPYRLLSNRSHSYFRTDEGLKEARFDFDTGITVSNGGMNAPLDDMAKYLGFLAGDEKRGTEYDVVLKRSSLEEMFVPVIEAAEGEGGGPGVSMALSFFVERHQGLEFVAHSGGQNGFISHFYLHRPSRTAYIVAFNTDVTTKDGRDLTRQLDAELREVMIKEMFLPSTR
ncbi:MAG: serine hydrolase domain-containing protein [Bacteroidales bacterium]